MIQFTASAENDLDEIYSFLAQENPDYAVKVITKLSSKFNLLEKNPTAGRTRHDLLINLRYFPTKSYLIFYTPIENGIEIYRVIHASRDIDTIFSDYFEGLENWVEDKQ